MEHETGTHTAGPWTVDAWGDDECDIYGPDDQLICSLRQEYCKDTGQGLNQNIEHDAALIAAAPEMLTALKQCKHLLRGYINNGYEEPGDQETYVEVSKAIAKAESEQGT
jgi:hypothetical protein